MTTLDHRVLTCDGIKQSVFVNTAAKETNDMQWTNTLMCNEGQHAMFRVDRFHTEQDREFLHLATSSAEEILSEYCVVLVLCSF